MQQRIPVRYSVDQADYSHSLGSRMRVSLNGTVQTHVLAYDCVAGTITRYATDRLNRFIIEGEELKTETLSGDVTVTLK
jgi:hypothetical protein